jgi:hypothetical protein
MKKWQRFKLVTGVEYWGDSSEYTVFGGGYNKKFWDFELEKKLDILIEA